MIISHKNKFIFIKTRKTAGTSVEIALSKFCGADDILTPISPTDEIFRNYISQIGAQNYKWQRSEIKHWILRCFKRKKLKTVFWLFTPWKDLPDDKKYYNHIPAEYIRKTIDRDKWNSYFKFTIERNPWDKAVSRYYWNIERGRISKTKSINKFIGSLAKKPQKLSDWHRYTYQNELLVDEVIFYENLVNDLSAVGKKLKLDNLQLPTHKAKSKSRKEGKRSEVVLTEHSRQIIADICQKEIELFGYKCKI